MKLKNVIYQQNQLGYHGQEFHSYDEFHLQQEDRTANLDTKILEQSPQNENGLDMSPSSSEFGSVEAPERRKRRRNTREKKNKDDVERQRLTHIEVERNRRKLMNEHLSIMRTLMPSSYITRGDQASIIGGAINFVKDLEHRLHTLESQKAKATQDPVPFSAFFNYPQYSIKSDPLTDRPQPGYADIEVNIVESHANLKIFSKKRAGQLLQLVNGFQCLGLTVLHLNVITMDEMVLYSLSLKIEEGSQLNTVDEVAVTVNDLLGRIEEEDVSSLSSSLN